MTLSRWRRIATGIAAGVLVLGAALLGASLRSDSNGVSVASDVRPTDVIAIPEDTDEPDDTVADGDGEGDNSVQVIEVDDLPDETSSDDVNTTPDDSESDAADSEADDAEAAIDATGDDAEPATDDTGAETAADDADEGADPATNDDADDTGDTATADAVGDDASAGDSDESASDEVAGEAEAPADPTPPPPAPTATPAPAAPPAATGNGLGTGGGVDDAECGLDRLVIYAGAPVGGVAGRLRAALAQNGFGAGCPSPVTVLASNCPQQFSGILGAGSGYDPLRPYVAASASVDRDTMTAIVGATGYTGSSIDILSFGFVNADRPGEQWVAIFVPPSFSGWEGLAGQAGLAPSSQSLCGASGELGR